ncbi:DUF6153 family protein [Kineococcus aurantiacus]|uniref:Uncharacterized protein n=1 Tax=Kineococcus aurantiacus TaxID=37633 RepID=A0A7Y9J124_9ACTN|nr:hypothetical protein [Kineococcus aurantiacus]
MSDARGPARGPVVPRVLLVVALVLGLCAMHVLAAAVSRHHATVHATAHATTVHGTGGHAPAGDHARPATAPGTPAAVRTTDQHDHHATTDCVLFLSAGTALLVVLLAWAAARALRPSYRLLDPWPGRVTATTPWRGPPPWHWPRIRLCVIRV